MIIYRIPKELFFNLFFLTADNWACLDFATKLCRGQVLIVWHNRIDRLGCLAANTTHISYYIVVAAGESITFDNVLADITCVLRCACSKSK